MVYGALSIRPKLSEVFGNFQWQMEQLFPQFPEKRRTSRDITKFPTTSYLEVRFHLILRSEFLEFSVEWFAFRKFYNFRIFRKFSKESFAPFAPVSKLGKCLVKWKAPTPTQCLYTNTLGTKMETTNLKCHS